MNNKKKILFIISKFNNLGATKNTIDLLNFIDLNKFDIKIIFIDCEVLFINQSDIYKLLKNRNISFIIINKILPSTSRVYFKINKIITNKLEIFIAKFKLYNFLKNFKPSYIYCNRPLYKKKYLLKYFSLNKIIFHFSLVPTIIKKISENDVDIINMSKKLLANNDENAKLYKQIGILQNKISVLPLAIDIKKIDQNFSTPNQQIIDIKNKNKFIIASIGPVSLRKGTDIFIKLANICHHDHDFKNFHFLWIGFEKDEDKILLNNKLPNNLTLSSHTKDIYSFIKYIDCLIICSRSEGGPIVLLESMYLKKNNISYNKCGISNELLSNNCGIIIKDNDPKKFKNAINNLFIEKKIFINKELAKQRIIDKYDVSKSILKFQDEFN